MGYTLLQIGDILLKADRTMYKIGSIAYDDMFNALDEALDYNRDIIYIYKKAVEYADDFYVGTEKLDTVVEKLGQKVAAYDFGKLTPIYSDATIVTSVVPAGAALNDLSDVTITNVQNNQILQYNSALGQWVNVGANAAVRTSQSFTATLNQTIFVTTSQFTAPLLDVYLNGVRLNSSNYSTFGNYTITLYDGCLADDIIDVTIYDPFTGIIDLSGYVPTSRTLTINGVTYDLTANRSWTVAGGVPYIGATGDVDLGEYEIKAGQVEFDQSPTGTAGVGVMRWNDSDGTLDLGLKGGNVTLQVGQEQVLRVVNKTGVNLLESQYRAVRIRLVSEGGSQGQRLAVVLAQGDNDPDSTTTIGIVTENIDNNQEGFITTSGEVRGINTTGSLQGETWVDGDIIYLSPTIPGGITKVKPIAPNHLLQLGYVIYAHNVNGKIFVKIDNGYELSELHDVYAPSPTDGQGIFWNTANLRYQNNTVAGILGYTPLSGSGVTGQVAYWNGTNSQTGSNNLFWDAANNRLGIGTTTPVAPLNVVASSDGNIVRFNGTRNTSVLFLNDAAGRGMLRVFGNTAATSLAGAYLECTGYEEAWVYVTANQASANNKVWRYGNLGISNYFAIQKLLDNGNIGTTPFIIHSSSSNIAIGSTFVADGGQRLQVYGDALIVGSGNTAATNALLITNSNPSTLVRVYNSGVVEVPNSIRVNTINSISGSLTISSPWAGSTSTIIQTWSGGDNGLIVEPTGNVVKTTGGFTTILGRITFAPTSGTATSTSISATPTINQTGGANGITRGLYIAPTLTAAADWRSIEWSNNTGWGLYGAGTAENFLGGNLTISRNQNANTMITVVNNTSAVNSTTSLRLQNTNINNFADFAKYSSTTTAYKIISANDAIIYNGGGGGDISILNDFPTGRIKFSAGGSSPAQMTLTAAGRLLLGTTTEGTFLLDVNGTARVSGNVFLGGTIPGVLNATSTSRILFGMLDSGYNPVGSYMQFFGKDFAGGNGKFEFVIDANVSSTAAFEMNRTIGGTFTTIFKLIQNGNLIIQNGGTFTDIASAKVQINSTTQGFLPPRMTNAQRAAISSPAVGLMVYCTDATEGLYQYINNAWVNLTGVVTNRQTASYTLALGDSNDLVELNVATANNLTVPLNSSIAFPIGTKIDIAQYGAGQTTVVATGGVTIRSAGGALKLAAQYSGASLVKIGTDEWYLFGDITV